MELLSYYYTCNCIIIILCLNYHRGHKVLSKVKVAIKKMNWEGITQEKAKEEVSIITIV